MKDLTLGQTYRDTVTGFQGVATSKTVFLNGCVRVALTPPAYVKDGEHKLGSAEYFDVEQLEAVPVPPAAEAGQVGRSGGPPAGGDCPPLPRGA
jgi:hypothetical protein